MLFNKSPQLGLIVKNISLYRKTTMSKVKDEVYPSKPTEDHFVNLSAMRKPYESDIFSKELASKDPINLFKEWFELACQTPQIQEANAMVVSTCSPSTGKPSSRYVLLKMFDKEGFAFFTNYNSRKGQELQENPNVSLLFYWDILHRQIRIEGQAQKVSPEISDQYFYSRPFASQVSAAISPQSQSIESRNVLEEKHKDTEDTFNGKKVPRPETWGGFKVIPQSFEFWQGLSSRLHDRVLFTKSENTGKDEKFLHQGSEGWVYQYLAP